MEETNHQRHYLRYHAWKLIVGILIVLAVFGIGFACGRFSAFFGGYGYMGPWMMYGGYGYPPYGYAVPQSEGVPPSATTTPAPYYYPMWRMMGGYYYLPQAT